MDSVNPCAPDWLDGNDNALLRGDAIGDTAYTHRWILKCLLAITEGLPKYINQEMRMDNKEVAIDMSSSKHDRISDILCNGSSDESKNVYQPEESTNVDILELDSHFEDAACQLWDMTAERDVALHLFSLEEIDIFQLASVIIEDSKAPRLTEVMVGIIANLCCQEEVCEKVLKKESEDSVLLPTLKLLRCTNDVPTLCEILRFVRLLLWYRLHRSPSSNWASCPLLKLFCKEWYRQAISFLLINSLSDALISSLLQFLSSFLFISLPETGLSIASLYSEKDIIDGLIDILTRKREFIVTPQTSEDQEVIIQSAIMCLYAFIDTPGSRLIQMNASTEETQLEMVLLSFIEREARVEAPENIVHVCDHITRAVGLSILLIPYIKCPTIILAIGKVMALIQGEAEQYSVNKSNLNGVKDNQNCSTNRDIISAISEDKELEKTRRRRSSEKDLKREYKHQYSNPSSEEFGWNSPPPVMVNLSKLESTSSPSIVDSNRSTIITPPGSSKDVPNHQKSESEQVHLKKAKLKLNMQKELEELKELLEDYCYQLLSYWWSDSSCLEMDNRSKIQSVILDTLDQCHAHEVLHILRAVRERDRRLVPKLQEQIIDIGSHDRLVALLAHMYQ